MSSWTGPFVCDASSPASVSAAFAQISSHYPEHKLKLAIFNVASPFILKPFLDISHEEMSTGIELNLLGAFQFAQHALPRLVEAGGGSLIFSGATASVRGGARFAAFAPGKFALRGLG